MKPTCKECGDEMIEYMERIFCPIHNVGCENKGKKSYVELQKRLKAAWDNDKSHIENLS